MLTADGVVDPVFDDRLEFGDSNSNLCLGHWKEPFTLFRGTVRTDFDVPNYAFNDLVVVSVDYQGSCFSFLLLFFDAWLVVVERGLRGRLILKGQNAGGEIAHHRKRLMAQSPVIHRN